jgi:hypothetical protein
MQTTGAKCEVCGFPSVELLCARCLKDRKKGIRDVFIFALVTPVVVMTLIGIVALVTG